MMSARLQPPVHSFADREDAAQRLARALSSFRGSNPLVLAIPRGGVPIGRIVANELEGELDVVLVRKLGAPQSSELAIGAIDEDARVQITDLAEHIGASRDYIEREARRQLAQIRQRRALYSPHRPRIDPAGRVVIIVDDGLATGATMRSAILAARAHKAKHLPLTRQLQPKRARHHGRAAMRSPVEGKKVKLTQINIGMRDLRCNGAKSRSR